MLEPGTPASDLFKKAASIIYDSLYRIASVIVGTKEEHIPMILIFDLECNLLRTVMIGNFITVDDKDSLARLQTQIADLGLISVLILESWVKNVPKDGLSPSEALKKRAGRSIANDPDRTEVIMFSFAFKQEGLVALCHIDRKNSKLDRADLVDILDGMTGRFVRERRVH